VDLSRLPKDSFRPERESLRDGIEEHAAVLNTGLSRAARFRGWNETVGLECRVYSQQLGGLPLLISSLPSFDQALLVPDLKLHLRDETLHPADEAFHLADEAFHLRVHMVWR
jgi:hypothetical protein